MGIGRTDKDGGRLPGKLEIGDEFPRAPDEGVVLDPQRRFVLIFGAWRIEHLVPFSLFRYL